MSGIGHIGELQVIDELQKKQKLEIYLPIKDKGIDFIGVGNNKSVQIQVKTSKFHKNSFFWFDLYKSKMIFSNNTFYIFVLYVLPRRKMMGKTKNYLIFPSFELKKNIDNGMISSKKNNEDCVSILIYPDFENSTWMYKNKGNTLDLKYYWNNFNLINEIME